MNGYNIPASNIVELVQDAITPDTTMFEANFSFNVNGAVYQDTKQHTAYWRVENPTLHVEYYMDETEMPDIETVVDASGTSDNDPSDGRYLMPRLLDKNMAEKARLRPSKVSLELNLHPLSTAQMMRPDGEAEVMVRDWVELFAPSGSVGVYRISETQKIRGNGGKVSVFLEHAFTTLADSMAAGVQAMTGSVAEVIATLLEAQTVKHWVLGDCDSPVDYEMIYEYVDDNLLKKLCREVHHNLLKARLVCMMLHVVSPRLKQIETIGLNDSAVVVMIDTEPTIEHHSDHHTTQSKCLNTTIFRLCNF
jgi:hypothetical protein